MKAGTVGFLFANKLKNQAGRNYTCVILKKLGNNSANYERKVLSSPIVNSAKNTYLSSEDAFFDVADSLRLITKQKSPSKFIGATVKDGNRETEIHSFLFDKLFAVRTHSEEGKNGFKIVGKKGAQQLLSKNLDVSI